MSAGSWIAKRCTGTGGRGCACQYHTWRRVYRAERRAVDRAVARVQTKRHLPLPKHDLKSAKERRYITTPAIQQAIAECRPLYLRLIGADA